MHPHATSSKLRRGLFATLTSAALLLGAVTPAAAAPTGEQVATLEAGATTGASRVLAPDQRPAVNAGDESGASGGSGGTGGTGGTGGAAEAGSQGGGDGAGGSGNSGGSAGGDAAGNGANGAETGGGDDNATGGNDASGEASGGAEGEPGGVDASADANASADADASVNANADANAEANANASGDADGENVEETDDEDDDDEDSTNKKTQTAPKGEAAKAAPKTAPFKDVPAKHQFRDQIAWLAGTKITTGYADGSFKPRAHVSRDAMAAFLERFDTAPPLPKAKYSRFTDVSTSHKFFREISWLSATGVTTGYANGRFVPAGSVERQAMAAFLYRAAGRPSFKTPTRASFSDVPRGHKFFREVEWLASTGITTGYADGTFRPKAPVERQAMAAFLQRFEQKYYGGRAQAAAGQTGAALAVTEKTDSSLVVAWQPVEDAKSYRLEWSRSTTGDLPAAQTFNAQTTSAKISGLRPGLGYRLQIVAQATSGGSTKASVATGKTQAVKTLSVATFNVVASKQVTKAWINWSDRRQHVWNVGNSRRPDVIGLQEAGVNTVDLNTGKPVTISPVTNGLPRFYHDVVRGWKAKDGTPYRLVNDKPWNCKKYWSSAETMALGGTRCTLTRKNVGATHDMRIAYNPTTVTLIDSGAYELPQPGNRPLPTTHGGEYENYLGWAVFEQHSTGKRFFFANVHLDYARRVLHAKTIRTKLASLNTENLPVVLLGDFSTTQWEQAYKQVIEPFKTSGFTELLGSKFGTSDRAWTGFGTAYLGRPNCNSMNAFTKQYSIIGAPNGLPKCSQTSFMDLGQNGAHVDYILAKGIKGAPVWGSMLDMDNNGRVQGTPPSDHAMLRAEVVL